MTAPFYLSPTREGVEFALTPETAARVAKRLERVSAAPAEALQQAFAALLPWEDVEDFAAEIDGLNEPELFDKIAEDAAADLAIAEKRGA